MKNIKVFNSPKYEDGRYIKVEEAVFWDNTKYLISICFQQEPEFGEGVSAKKISQYPLEDILDNTGTYVNDFYEDLNTDNSDICYLELASLHIEGIRAVHQLCGRHVFNKVENGSVELIIE